MRPYEVMVIFDTTNEPSAIQAVVDRVLDTVRSSGGVPGAVDRWGRRPFAYEVNHKREGYYVLVEFSSEVPTVRDLDRLLSLADEVVRHKVIRLPERPVRRAVSRPERGAERPAPHDRPERPGRHDRAERPGRRDAPERPGRHDRAEPESISHEPVKVATESSEEESHA